MSRRSQTVPLLLPCLLAGWLAVVLGGTAKFPASFLELQLLPLPLSLAGGLLLACWVTFLKSLRGGTRTRPTPSFLQRTLRSQATHSSARSLSSCAALAFAWNRGQPEAPKP